jgi:hypothetical protein
VGPLSDIFLARRRRGVWLPADRASGGRLVWWFERG